jgi:hypothetical protein
MVVDQEEGAKTMTDSKDERSEGHLMPPVRDAHDSTDDVRLQRNPAHEDAKLDVAVDETFPASDPPASTQPGKGSDPAPSSGYDPALEERLRSKE